MIEITILIDGLIVKGTKLKRDTLESGPKKLSDKTVQKDENMQQGKIKLKVSDKISKNCNIYLKE